MASTSPCVCHRCAPLCVRLSTSQASHTWIQPQPKEEKWRPRPTAIDIDITLRHLNGDGAAVKQHVLNKLTGVVRALPAVKRASVEVTYQASRPRHHQHIVQATLTVGGAVLRAEEMGPDPRSTIDSVRGVLERRIRD